MASADRNHNHDNDDNNDADRQHATAAVRSRSLFLSRSLSFSLSPSLPPHSADRKKHWSLATTSPTVSISQSSRKGVRPRSCSIPDDFVGEGAISTPHSPPSLSRHRRAESDRQQRFSLANTAKNATQRPFESLPFSLPPENIKKQPLEQDLPATQTSIESLSTSKLFKKPIDEKTRSKPIPIAITRKPPKHIELTPLSGRPPPNFVADHFHFPNHRSRPSSPGPSFHRHNSTPVRPLSSDEKYHTMSSRPNPSSPLSPAATAQPMPIPHHQFEEETSRNPSKARPRPVTQSLNLAALPKYHPAVSYAMLRLMPKQTLDKNFFLLFSDANLVKHVALLLKLSTDSHR